jgi:ferredoxin
MMIRLSVDEDMCTGHGRCYTVAPELLTFDDEGFVTIRGQTIDVPAALEAAARDAEMACPESAISIIEVSAA